MLYQLSYGPTDGCFMATSASVVKGNLTTLVVPSRGLGCPPHEETMKIPLSFIGLP